MTQPAPLSRPQRVTQRVTQRLRRALVACGVLGLSACQLIGPLERELSAMEEELGDEVNVNACLLQGAQGAPWWVGAWGLDHERLKLQLLEQLSQEVSRSPEGAPPTVQGGRVDTVSSVFVQSLAGSFALQVTAQQASLMLEGRWTRFPIALLPKSAGLRLTSLEAHKSSTLWCQGESVYWSAEGGSPLPVKRSEQTGAERQTEEAAP